MERNSSNNQPADNVKSLSALQQSVDNGFRATYDYIKKLEQKVKHLEEKYDKLRDELDGNPLRREVQNNSSYTGNTPSPNTSEKHNREENTGNTGKQKSVSRNSWIVVGLSIITSVIVIVGLLIYLEPERNVHKIMHAASEISSTPENAAILALMTWYQDKRSVRNFRKLICDEDKRDDLVSFFGAMADHKERWRVVDHLSVESNWPDAGRVIIVHYINGQGQYRNSIVDSNGNMRIFPGEKGKYYYSYQDIQKAKVPGLDAEKTVASDGLN